MFNLFKKKEVITAPVAGTIIPLEEVKDPVFSQKMMGDGFAVVPSGQTVYAPMSGIISVCFPTHHAIGMKMDNGAEVLIHIGIDTVKLGGEGFKALVEQGQTIKQGDPLVHVDLNLLKTKGYDATVMVVFPNQDIKVEKITQTIKENESVGIKF